MYSVHYIPNDSSKREHSEEYLTKEKIRSFFFLFLVDKDDFLSICFFIMDMMEHRYEYI